MKVSLYLRSVSALVALLLVLTGCLGLRCDAACGLGGLRVERGQVHAVAEHCPGMAMAMPHDGVRAPAACSMAKSCVPVTVAPLPQLAELGPALLPRHFEAFVFLTEDYEATGAGAWSTTARSLQIPPLLQAGSLRV